MKTKKIVTSAMLIGFALILSFVQVFALPFGGSITLVSMLPVILIGFLFGTKAGLIGGFCYSILQMIVGMGTVSAFFLPGDSQMAPFTAITICFIDYILAYTVLGLGGVFRPYFKKDLPALILGVVFTITLRYIMHIISGYIFFGQWAEWFFADSTGLSQVAIFKGFCTWVLSNFSGSGLSLIYSVIYNGAYMIPELIITLIITPIVFKAIKKIV
ncbi:MAG: energy-coupled thiamine transporter ThiT [Clostridia bacterium]|nr:energy-coupled thiamine transporter ThiT [Clostridia bacterium]